MVVYAVHTNYGPLLLGLALGWVVTFVGSRRWGARFAVAVLPVGLLIPASPFLLRPGLWRALLDPEIAAWNAAYWLIPASAAAGLALVLRNLRSNVR